MGLEHAREEFEVCRGLAKEMVALVDDVPVVIEEANNKISASLMEAHKRKEELHHLSEYLHRECNSLEDKEKMLKKEIGELDEQAKQKRAECEKILEEAEQ